MADAPALCMKLLLVASAVMLTMAAAAPPQRAPAAINLPLHLTGALISAGGVGNPTGTARVEIRVNRWSSADERNDFLKALGDKGQDALLERLSDARSVGTI